MSIDRKLLNKTNHRFSRRTFIKSSVGLAATTVAGGGLLRSANAQSQFSEYIPYDATRDYHYGLRYGTREIIEHHHPGTEPTGEKFTFVRLKYPGGDWWTNLVNVHLWQSDLKFTQVLERYTAIDVDLRKHPQYVDIDDSWLFAYPFLYMTGHGRARTGGMRLTDAHIRKLREYFERGGFLHVEDCDIRWNLFWPQIENMMQRIYPNKKFERLDMSHPIYHTLYPHDDYLGGDKLIRGYEYDQAIMDDDRVMVYFCPSDLNCAWEGRPCFPGGEEQRAWAFEQGMNVVAYALTR
ncbi:hypothetical protein C6501_10150 [Candidatus Poribacteria bacterium]|nr:MAG: hypothetical protein C6501_10150 [Candidatus Poribacteria bacterium]